MKDKRQKLGVKGERVAEKFLKRKRMKLVERNYRCASGEIDLIMTDGDELVIVEVRTVTRLHDLDAEEMVPLNKRRQIVRVIQHLLTEMEDPLPPIRIDLCIVVFQPKPRVIHYRDAFQENNL